MSLYYQDDQVTLYLGDCLQETAWLEADVLCTDPPYGRGWKQGHLKRSKSMPRGGIQGDTDTTVRDQALEMWGDRQAVVFGDLMLAPPPRNKLTMPYRKPPDAGARGAVGGFRRDAEAIYLLGPWPSGIGGQSSVIATGARVQGGTVGAASRYGHPHAKPVDVMEQLILACPDGVIADPFAGSGSTLVAARNLGRRAIGVELEEEYCERAAKRLRADSLFSGGVA